MASPPPGNEPRHQRECAFCPRVGNRATAGAANYEKWHRCKPTGVDRSLKPPSKKHFPQLTHPRTGQTGVPLCVELIQARRMEAREVI